MDNKKSNKEGFNLEKWKESIDQLGEILTENQRESYHSKLESFDTYKSKQKQKIGKECERIASQYRIAYDLLVHRFFDKGSTFSLEEKKAIQREFQQGQENLIKEINSDTLPEKIKEGKTFQEILGYSNDTLEKCYQIGLDCFEKGNYEEAVAIFSLLTLMNHYFHNFWVCLAMSHQAQHHWDLALQTYELAKMTDKEDPIPYLYAGECCIRLHDDTKALDNFNQAIPLAKHHPNADYRKFVDVIQKRKELFLQKKS